MIDEPDGEDSLTALPTIPNANKTRILSAICVPRNRAGEKVMCILLSVVCFGFFWFPTAVVRHLPPVQLNEVYKLRE